LWKIKSSKEKYASQFVKIYDDTLILPNNKEISFTRLALRDFVTVLPILSDKVIFIKNYRYPANKSFLELPSGIIEQDETPETCAHRELKEETGYDGTLTHITWYHPIDRSLQKAHIYYADIADSTKTKRDETENQQVIILPIEKALMLFKKGTIKHAPTIIAIGLFKTILTQKAEK